MAAIQNNVVILNETDPRFSTAPSLVTSGGVTTIPAGIPTKGADATAASPWTGAVLPMASGDGTTSQRFTGISKSDSTDTASANGSVVLWLPLPGYVYSCKAETASTANTSTLIQALYGKRVTFYLTSSVYSVNAAAADAAANMVTIIGGDPTTTQLYFTYKNTGSVIGQIA